MSLLSPKSIVVIGASHQEGKVGHDIFKNLATQGYEGELLGVNPKGGELFGRTVHASIQAVPNVPELAIVVVPAAAVPQALTECGEKGVKQAVVISAGFSEIHTEAGKKLEEELVRIATQYGISLVGPNCLGFLNTHAKLNASFAKELPPAGNVAFVSQSGATAVALMDAASAYGIGFSKVVSIGNKAAMDECALLEMLRDDDQTNVIAFYLESFKDGRAFLKLASAVTKEKPIVLLKSGVSQAGASAASSHTGALAGSDAAVNALCKQAGIHRARTSEELFDMVSVLSTQPVLPSNRIAIITNAGGPGILATDAAEAHKLQLPALTEFGAEKLRALLPPAASVQNPIDCLGDAGADRYEAAVTSCRMSANIEGIVVLLTPQVMTPCEDIAQTIVRVMKKAPLMPTTVCFMGGESVTAGVKILRANGIPCFPTPERAVAAMGVLATRAGTDVPAVVETYESHISTTHASSRASLPPTAGLLSENMTAELFAAYGLPMPAQAVAGSATEAANIATKLGFPVVAKISSPHILHKTDMGGVQVNLKDETAVQNAYEQIMANAKKHAPQATLNGVLIQKFLPAGEEFIVGITRDASFGPLIMVGLGGIYTELFRDTAFRIAPVNADEAYRMLQALTSWKLLLGMRGKAQADIDALADLIVKLSQLAIAEPRVAELDINPVIVRPDGIVIADAKVVLRT